MRPGTRKNFGELTKAVVSIGTQSSDASADIEGSAVDRSGYFGAVAHCVTGSATGGASAQVHRFKVQHSDTTTAGDFVDLTENGPNNEPVFVDVEADDTVGKISLNLEVAKKYLRLVYVGADSSFTGGSTPANDVTGLIELAYKDEGLEG